MPTLLSSAHRGYRTTSTVDSATSFSSPDPPAIYPPRRFNNLRASAPVSLVPTLKARNGLRKSLLFIVTFLFLLIFFLSNIRSPDNLLHPPDDPLHRYSHAASHFRHPTAPSEHQPHNPHSLASPPTRSPEYLILPSTLNSLLTKCAISPLRSVFHSSLLRGPDKIEIQGRAAAKQPRDFEDTFATIDRKRFYFHPDRTAVQTVDALGAGLDKDLDDAITIARAITEADVGVALHHIKVPMAYMRTTRQDGSLTIVNIGAMVNHSRISNHPTYIRRMVTVARTYNSPCQVSFARPKEIVRINVILPYSHRPHRLSAFLKMFAIYFHSAKTHMVRIIISTTNAERHHVESLRDKYPELTSSRLIVLTSNGDEFGNFSRAVAIREAAKIVPSDEVMFFSDADLIIGGNFLQNCRVNVIKGYQIWFPVMFSLYPYGKSLSSKDGLWRRSSYGMTCMYQSDFVKIGGFGGNEETAFTGWGSEDVFLYNKFRDSDKYAIFRTLEPGLQHLWHGKECEHNEHYENCMRTVYMTIGSQEAVAKLMSEKHIDVSLLTKNALPV